MSWHIVTSTYFDFELFQERRARDEGPLHVVDQLVDRLNATVHQPGGRRISWRDRLGGLLIGSADHWAQARSVLAKSKKGDSIYATGSDCGLPIALLSAFGRRRRVAVYFVAPSNVRPAFIVRLISRLPGKFLAVAGTKQKVGSLTNLLGGRKSGVHFANEQTDTGFFTPAVDEDARSADLKPDTGALIASCGLEQRDYVTLTRAVEDLNATTKVCAVSPNFTPKTRVAMPDQLPARFEMRDFDFAELRQLYRQADVTVIPLLPNDFSAGLTVLLEALSCGSPVVVTETDGLVAEFIERDFVIGVAPQEPELLRKAIDSALQNPEEAYDRTHRARLHILTTHTSEHYLDELVGALTTFESK